MQSAWPLLVLKLQKLSKNLEGHKGFMKQFLVLASIGLGSMAIAIAAPNIIDQNTQVPIDAVVSVGAVVVGGAWYLGAKINRFQMELELMKKAINRLRCVRENKCDKGTDLEGEE